VKLPPAPEVPATAAAPSRPGTLDPGSIARILADFGDWLAQARELPEPAAVPSFDLATLVQQFTALRQEVNLQTRASRAQLEQNSTAVDLLRQSLESIQQQQARLQEAEQTEQNERVRPLVKTLIDAHDALALARKEVQRKLEQMSAPATPATPPEPIRIKLPFWARWLGLEASVVQQLAEQATPPEQASQASAEPFRPILDALLVGYQMSLQRIERSLTQEGLEKVPCAGLPFDPETMEVLEVVREPGRTGTVVIEEVRPGYLWKGRLFRFAQVRVARA
jgi:molecular chaperone GrpE